MWSTMAVAADHVELTSIKESKGLKVIHINIRSLLPIRIFQYEFLDEKLDIVLLSETWLRPSLPNNLILSPGYNLARKDRRLDKRGGGLCVFLRNNIIYEELSLPNNCPEADLEWLCLKTSIGGNKKQIILLLYRPPSGNPSTAIEMFKSCLDFFQTNHRNSKLTIIGDMNFNYKNDNCTHVKSLKLFENLYNIRKYLIRQGVRPGQSR